MKIIILILFLFFLSYILTPSKKIIENFKQKKDVCRGTLTDREYLEHMIPHHQVAVDISIILQKITKSPYMQHILDQLFGLKIMKFKK